MPDTPIRHDDGNHGWQQNQLEQTPFQDFEGDGIPSTKQASGFAVQISLLLECMHEYDTTQHICLWKFGYQHPTSPLLPPRKDPLLHNCTSAATV
ncbi:hypothetical protein F511_15397 [Dorcoceras hygrometricum]|uniref:Uncharacterized protein n=1 Tax=Dorcoceras hygrometricum TaxID=472368 RepID=A0A2Z7C9S9_9LAMI|nr:hypothetical protein F511_15397 [Dorcoceras hygrometricum]